MQAPANINGLGGGVHELCTQVVYCRFKVHLRVSWATKRAWQQPGRGCAVPRRWVAREIW